MAKALLQKRSRDPGHLFLGRPCRILLSFSPITSSLCEPGCDVICHACNNTTFPGGSVVKQSTANAGDTAVSGSISGWGRSPGGKNSKPTPVFLPGKSHGQRSLAGSSTVYSPWGCKEWDTTKVTEHGIRGAHGIYAITQKSDL